MPDSLPNAVQTGLTRLKEAREPAEKFAAFGSLDSTLGGLTIAEREAVSDEAERQLLVAGFSCINKGNRPAVVLALARGEVWRNGEMALSVGRSKLLRKLLSFIATDGRRADRQTIFSTVWGQPYLGKSSDNSLHVAINRLRKKVDNKGLHIESTNLGGFSFSNAPRVYRWTSNTKHCSSDAPPFSPICPTNLTPLTDSSFGHDQAQLSVRQAMASEQRLITLIGPGGSGKTRLAQMVGLAATQAPDPPDGGIWFMDLDAINTVDGFFQVLSTTLDIPLKKCPTMDATLARILTRIQDGKEKWLILDNFEHIADKCAPLVHDLLRQSARLRVLVTSREALNIPDEHLVEVQALPSAPAIDLFLNRSRAFRASDSTDESTRATIAQIVEKLDGLPLAIELAAARMRMLSPTQILARLSDSIRILSNDNPNRPARHQTLEATIAWSWNLLNAWEKDALAQCAIFRGGFTPEAAEVLIDLRPHNDAPWTLEVLEELQDQCLVQQTRHPELQGETRYRLYNTIRTFALAHLERSDALESTKQRHANWAIHRCAVLLDACATATSQHPNLRLNLELDNLLAAVDHTRSKEPLKAIDAALILAAVLRRRGPLVSVLKLLESLLPTAIHTQRVRLLLALAETQSVIGNNADALISTQQAEALIRSLNAKALMHEADFRMARIAYVMGDLSTATQRCVSSVDGFANCRDFEGQSKALALQSTISRWQGNMSAAKKALEKALALQRHHGFRGAQAVSLTSLGAQARHQGHFTEAETAYREAIGIYHQLQPHTSLCFAMQQLGILLADSGRVDEALETLQSALNIARTRGAYLIVASLHMNIGSTFLDSGDLVQAERYLHLARVAHVHHGRRVYEAVALGNLAWVHWRRGEIADVQSHLEQTISRMSGSSTARILAHFRAGQAALLADDCPRSASAVLDASAKVFEDGSDRMSLAYCRVLGGFVDLARARATDQTTARNNLIEKARERIARAENSTFGPAPSQQSIAVRTAIHVLHTQLSVFDQ